MKIETVDFFYLRMPVVKAIGDGKRERRGRRRETQGKRQRRGSAERQWLVRPKRRRAHMALRPQGIVKRKLNGNGDRDPNGNGKLEVNSNGDRKANRNGECGAIGIDKTAGARSRQTRGKQ